MIYFVFGLILLFIVIFTLPVESIGLKWTESCYGEECLDRPEPNSRNDWGYQALYCNEMYSFSVLNETDDMTFYNMTKVYCSI